MKVDLNNMYYSQALSLIGLCVENKIDVPNSDILLNELSALPVSKDIVWELDVPESYLTWFLLTTKYEILE